MIVVETGTDVASLGVGDPFLLQELRDARSVRGFEAARARAEASGAFWGIDIGVDGDYVFHVYVGDQPPESVRAWMRDPVVRTPFRVPSGTLLVAGQEAFAGPNAAPASLGRTIEVAPGSYQLTAWRVIDPDDDLFEENVWAMASVAEKRALVAHSRRLKISLLTTLAAAFLMVLLVRAKLTVPLVGIPLVVATLAWVAWLRVHSSAAYRSVASKRLRLSRELSDRPIELVELPDLPSIVLVLAPLD